MEHHSFAFSFFVMLLLAGAVIGVSVAMAWLIIRHLHRNHG
ncbi:hypothetical protein SAMN02745857_03181 [Andreprevotia lacus DSM 23236]|jgi:hypothetical protein|uniref:Uncharacterized protein n=1 Tax=Andreprevotia lacus DSM 23236 TaxID=1121001 RepID=A0A1W1XW85_9NEIS|nr:hypothetical protein [Andreprevotia lacus]SMC28250.1 hypothetical protein SAMN02745857_03181 [Andreprevotia lacus DSM 23236]